MDKQNYQAYDYMSLLRTLSLIIIVLVLVTPLTYAAKLYGGFLILLFLTSNYLLWRDLIKTQRQLHLLLTIETLAMLALLAFAPNVYFVSLLCVQILTVCIMFERLLVRNLYAIFYTLLGLGYSLWLEWELIFELNLTVVLLNNLLIYIFFYLVGSAISKLETQKRELKQLNEALTAHARLIKELAITEERNRLARDIHDTVAHRATGLIMQLQAVKAVLSKKPEQAAAVIEESLQVARKMLEEMRRSVRALAPTEAEDLLNISALETLLNDFAAQTGAKCSLQVAGKPYLLNSEQQIAVYRVMQEALTNASRHANAANIEVLITYFEAEFQMQITSDGVIPQQIKEGFGIQSMRQRVEQLAGEFYYTITDKEKFEVKITLNP